MASIYLSVILVVLMGSLSEARSPMVNLRMVKNSDVAGVVDPNALGTGPQLMYCRGKFMRMAYEMFCMIPDEYEVAMWDMNGVPLKNDSKYQQIPGKYGNFKTLTLNIMQLDERDVGRYSLNIANREGTSMEVFYLTDKEACGHSMMCFENPCTFPRKLSCPSIPEAHCVVDMCSTDMAKMCKPVWYVGLESVDCPDKMDEGHSPVGISSGK